MTPSRTTSGPVVRFDLVWADSEKPMVTMTQTQGVTIPARIHIQEITAEDGEPNLTHAMIADFDLPSRPNEGERLPLKLPAPGWWLQVSGVSWQTDGPYYHVTAKLVREDGHPAMMNEIETVLKEAGFRVDQAYTALMELMESPETEGLSFDELLERRDERLRELGHEDHSREIDRAGWVSVCLLVHELEYDEEDGELAAEIPPLMLDTHLPCPPELGDRISFGGQVPELFAVGEVNSEIRPGVYLTKLHACAPIDDFDGTLAGLRAAGFVYVPSDE